MDIFLQWSKSRIKVVFRNIEKMYHLNMQKNIRKRQHIYLYLQLLIKGPKHLSTVLIKSRNQVSQSNDDSIPQLLPYFLLLLLVPPSNRTSPLVLSKTLHLLTSHLQLQIRWLRFSWQVFIKIQGVWFPVH